VAPVLAAEVAVAVDSALATVFMPLQYRDGDEPMNTPPRLSLLIPMRNNRLSERRLNFCRGN